MAPTTRAMRARAAASFDRLPLDVLFSILLRLPAREVCQLRTVCRSWRSVASDPVFIRAHADCHREPLFLAKFRRDMTHVYVVDLAGNVLKRIASADGGHHVMCTRLNLACLAADWNRCRVLNPATGAVQVLPQGPAPEHKNRVTLSDPYTFFALGLVASTGEYKVFRMFNRLGFLQGGEQLFEVLTMNSCSTGHSGWKAKPKPNLFIEARTGVVVDAVVYFLISTEYNRAFHTNTGIRPDYIISFDIGREEWRRDLRGPMGDSIYSGEDLFSRRSHLALAELKGSLVLVYNRRQQFIMDLWFLMDFENGLWGKEYTIQTELIVPSTANLDHVKPILVLNDGRLVIHQALTGFLVIWDPRSNNFAEVKMGCLDSVGMYTGSLLSLQ